MTTTPSFTPDEIGQQLLAQATAWQPPASLGIKTVEWSLGAIDGNVIKPNVTLACRIQLNGLGEAGTVWFQMPQQNAEDYLSVPGSFTAHLSRSFPTLINARLIRDLPDKCPQCHDGAVLGYLWKDRCYYCVCCECGVVDPKMPMQDFQFAEDGQIYGFAIELVHRTGWHFVIRTYGRMPSWRLDFPPLGPLENAKA